jgi:hypothetical protein
MKMKTFSIEGKKKISLFEFWGGLSNHYHALISLGYSIPPDNHYFYYENDFDVEAYKIAQGGELYTPKHLINHDRVNLENISLARYNTDGVLIWKHIDVMAVCDNNNFYINNNHLQVLRLVEECKTKFLVFESRYFGLNETEKIDTLKYFLKKMSELGYIIKEMSLENSEYFSLLKQKKPYFVFYLPSYVSFRQNSLEKKVQFHYFFSPNYRDIHGKYIFNIRQDKEKFCRLRIYQRKPFTNFNTVTDRRSHFNYTPLDKYEVPVIFRPKGLYKHKINKVNTYISEVKKIYNDDKKEFQYIRPKIGWYSYNEKGKKYLCVTEISVRELLLQYGFYSESSYYQNLGNNPALRRYIKDRHNEQKIIKSLANSSSVNVLKYIYSSIFIYIKKREVGYDKKTREQYKDLWTKDNQFFIK